MGYLFETCRCVHVDYYRVEQEEVWENARHEAKNLVDIQEAATLSTVGASDDPYCPEHGGIAIRRCVDCSSRLCAGENCGTDKLDSAWRCFPCDRSRTLYLERQEKRRKDRERRKYEALPKPPPEEIKRGLLGYRLMHDGSKYQTGDLVTADYAAAIALMHGQGPVVWKRYWHENYRLFDPSGSIMEYDNEGNVAGGQIKAPSERAHWSEFVNIAEGEPLADLIDRQAGAAREAVEKAAAAKRRRQAADRSFARRQAWRWARFALMAAIFVTGGAFIGSFVLGSVSGFIIGLAAGTVLSVIARPRKKASWRPPQPINKSKLYDDPMYDRW